MDGSEDTTGVKISSFYVARLTPIFHDFIGKRDTIEQLKFGNQYPLKSALIPQA